MEPEPVMLAAWAERCLPLVGDYAGHVAGALRMAAR